MISLNVKLTIKEWICWCTLGICNDSSKCELDSCHFFVMTAIFGYFLITITAIYLLKLFTEGMLDWINNPPTEEELAEYEKLDELFYKHPGQSLKLAKSFLLDKKIVLQMENFPEVEEKPVTEKRETVEIKRAPETEEKLTENVETAEECLMEDVIVDGEEVGVEEINDGVDEFIDEGRGETSKVHSSGDIEAEIEIV